MAEQMDTKMVACLVDKSAVLSAASMDEHWADQTVALLEVTMAASRAETWVALKDVMMVACSVVDSAVCWVASMDETKAVRMDACLVELTAASTAVTWVA